MWPDPHRPCLDYMTDSLIIIPHNLIVSITNLNTNVNKLYSAPREIMLVENNNDVFASVENIIVKFVNSMICYI